jgi:hypothetical protein
MKVSIAERGVKGLLTFVYDGAAAIPSGHLHALFRQHVVLDVTFFYVLFK